jgi:hypothetical protein
MSIETSRRAWCRPGAWLSALPTRRLPAASALCAALLTACGVDLDGSDGNAFVAGTAAAAKVSLEPAGANCAYGGSRIESGIDADNNGTLEAGEVTGVQYACNGAPGASGSDGAQGANGSPGLTSLVRIDAEAAGANCAYGGSKIGWTPTAMVCSMRAKSAA